MIDWKFHSKNSSKFASNIPSIVDINCSKLLFSQAFFNEWTNHTLMAQSMKNYSMIVIFHCRVWWNWFEWKRGEQQGGGVQYVQIKTWSYHKWTTFCFIVQSQNMIIVSGFFFFTVFTIKAQVYVFAHSLFIHRSVTPLKQFAQPIFHYRNNNLVRTH